LSRFLVIERVKGSIPFAAPDSPEAVQMAALFKADIEYKLKLQKQGKIISGGPFLDILADCYILQVKTVEEMGEIFFNSPTNFLTDREVHPLGTFEDTLEGMNEMMPSSKRKSRKR
jgi:hypothetical protein